MATTGANAELGKLLERAGPGKRVYAFDHRGHVEVVRHAIRVGQRAEKGQPIVNDEWTHACVEGDQGWTELATGVYCPESTCRYLG